MSYSSVKFESSESSSSPSFFGEVVQLLNAAVVDGVFPGCVCAIAQGQSLLLSHAAGDLSFAPLEDESRLSSVSTETVYDLDSLTSSLVTVPLVMKAFEEKRFALTDRVSRYLHGFSVFGKSKIRILDLLLHQSGLAANETFYSQLDSIQKNIPFGTPVGRGVAQHLLMFLNRTELKATPRTQQQYSEVGMLALGYLVEALWAKRIDRLANKFIFSPLNIRSSGFIDHALVKQGKFTPSTEMIAPSEECPWRKRVLHGEVRDENTWAIGGASGEAGLFATAEDVTRIAQSLMASFHGDSGALISQETARLFLSSESVMQGSTNRGASGSYQDSLRNTQRNTQRNTHSNSRQKNGEDEARGGWQLGWANARAAFGIEPPRVFAQSIGSVSPSGCAVWMDPYSKMSIVLLSNRAMPSRANKKIGTWWPKFLKAGWSSIMNRSADGDDSSWSKKTESQESVSNSFVHRS